MSDVVKGVQVLVLGERNYPLSPLFTVGPEITGPLGVLVEEARQRLPDLGYDDVVKLVLRVGMKDIPAIFAAGGRVERHGYVSFSPLKEGRAHARLAALRTELMERGLLDQSMVLADREEVPTHVPPKNTLPQVQETPSGDPAPVA